MPFSTKRAFVDFFYFWFVGLPTYLAVILSRTLQLINQELAISLMFRMLFVPLFGDTNIIGILIGFIFRLTRIAIGLLALAGAFLLFVFGYLIWAATPILIIVLFKTSSIPIFLIAVITHYLLTKDRPLKKLPDVKSYESPLLATSQTVTNAITNPHYLEKLLSLQEVKGYLNRLGVTSEEFRRELLAVDTSTCNKETLLKFAFKTGQEKNYKYLEAPLIFCSIFKVTPIFDNILTKYELTTSLLEGTLDFWQYREELSHPLTFWNPDYRLEPMGGVNRGWTARPTPTLDQFSEDLTREAAKNLLPRPIGKDKVIKEIVEVLSRKTRQNILLVGEAGCGKTSAVKGIAYEIVEGTHSPALRFKRLVSLDVGALIGGAETPGALSGRISTIINEIKACRNIILFVDEVHNLAANTSGDPNQSSIFGALEPHLSAGELEFIGATSSSNFRKFIEPNEAFTRVLEKVEMAEATPEETLEILKYVSAEFESTHKVIISYPALVATIDLSKKLVHDRVLPDKAVDILESACVAAAGENRVTVTKEVVAEVISKLTKIPITNISADESKKLLGLSEELHKRIIGQEGAVRAITSAMQRARVGLREENKPIASFLFAGPTGVGKTETAKALAASYFGDEKLMIRFDMSEYQDATSAERLIDRLTTEVRQKPFALLLLDEVEKAHPNITLLFLQVLDDGRLTNTDGRVVDFTNTIIIATSNVGSHAIQAAVKEGVSQEELGKRQQRELLTRFAPEFLNRFSGLITFAPLTANQIKQIVRLKLSKLAKQLKAKLIAVDFSDDLVELLAVQGFDPEWGARPLNRLIADKLETKLAQEILAGNLKKGDTLTIDQSFIL